MGMSRSHGSELIEGHALNRILKDIINRYQIVAGNRVQCGLNKYICSSVTDHRQLYSRLGLSWTSNREQGPREARSENDRDRASINIELKVNRSPIPNLTPSQYGKSLETQHCKPSTCRRPR